jgi:hypothetical protein
MAVVEAMRLRRRNKFLRIARQKRRIRPQKIGKTLKGREGGSKIHQTQCYTRNYKL